MSIHRWSITELDSNTVVRRGACESNYGDESLSEVFGTLTGLGVSDAGINAVSDDLHARYGRTLGGGVELNIRPGENEHVEAVHGNYRLDLTVDPHP
ncbi:hypothetical protein [Mycobacteroides abscessus]|uniref:hypothetical protein n=1 Tax=Mycobacteroides abscessus TaxID=36809 RepID=UPI00092A0B69|nr:hypothetical protein [Mycobacteroides abscessus]SIN21197.1 Uncharacterised protein [Mycobacteroides abscessus subsp. abscessus]